VTDKSSHEPSDEWLATSVTEPIEPRPGLNGLLPACPSAQAQARAKALPRNLHWAEHGSRLPSWLGRRGARVHVPVLSLSKRERVLARGELFRGHAREGSLPLALPVDAPWLSVGTGASCIYVRLVLFLGLSYAGTVGTSGSGIVLSGMGAPR
jgi:hypothetical protein